MRQGRLSTVPAQARSKCAHFLEVTLRIHPAGGGMREEKLICRIDTLDEVEYFRHGGILQYVLRSLLKAA